MAMLPADRLATLETEYLAARAIRDRLDVARATGHTAGRDALEAAARVASEAVHARLATFVPLDEAALSPADLRAYRSIRAGIDVADDYQLPFAPPAEDVVPLDAAAAAAWLRRHHGDALGLRSEVEGAFAALASALPVAGGLTLSRLAILDLLATEPAPATRHDLFRALTPLWRAVDGDGDAHSPYRTLVTAASPAWRRGGSVLAANAVALGVDQATVEAWVLATLAAWRAVVVEPARVRREPPVEPWDWWWTAGTASRAVGRVDFGEAMRVNQAFFAALGADPVALGARFDVVARRDRPAIPVAFTTFGSRPWQRPDGTWDTGAPTVMAGLGSGGFAELGELVHETGHAVHLAGIRTRPAFTDWPDSDALTEALADIPTLELTEPGWIAHWLPGADAISDALLVRSRFAEVALDAAWALFEIRLHVDPSLRPNDVWTDITSTWLGIAPHPDWSWWAIRGQLVESPGYMANYATGAVLATALRAVIRRERGPWTLGDPGWYGWMVEHLYRFGLERSSREVVEAVLGGPPTADALVAEIARAG